MNDWIHTRRGVRLVEGTLPRLAAALEDLTAELKSGKATEGLTLPLPEDLGGIPVLWHPDEVPWSHAERWRQEHPEGDFITDMGLALPDAVTSWLQGDETAPSVAMKEYIVLLKHKATPYTMTRGEMQEQIVQICNVASLWERFGLSGAKLSQAIMQEA